MNKNRRGFRPRFPEEEIGRIVERLAAGERADDVAAEWGLQGESLRRTLRRRGIVIPKPARPETPHGSTRYRNHGCRCDVCTRANTARARRRLLDRDGTEPPVHNASGYGNYGCRCDTCTRAHKDRLRRRAERREHNDRVIARLSMPR